jgi:hypothetical protein
MSWHTLPTVDLARDTIERAKQVHDVNEAAWEALGPAFLAAVPLAFVLPLAVVGIPTWSYVVLVALAVWGAAPWVLRWHRAIRAADAYTNEMRERRLELERRKAPSISKDRD